MKPEEKERYISAIENAQKKANESSFLLLHHQRRYLLKIGFVAEPIECDGTIFGHTYSIGDEIFTDEDHAIEWLEEQEE